VPTALFEMLGYWNYWHGERAYSGVSLHVRQEAFPERPVFAHPDFDYENRIVTAELPGLTVASVYVPNGGKDFPAKMRFSNRSSAGPPDERPTRRSSSEATSTSREPTPTFTRRRGSRP
jgi:exonuclease III